MTTAMLFDKYEEISEKFELEGTIWRKVRCYLKEGRGGAPLQKI